MYTVHHNTSLSAAWAWAELARLNFAIRIKRLFLSKTNEVEYILELSHSIGRTQIKVVDHPLFVYKSPGTLNVQLGCIYSAYMYCVSRLFQNLNYAFFSSFECFFEIYDLENPQIRIQ